MGQQTFTDNYLQVDVFDDGQMRFAQNDDEGNRNSFLTLNPRNFYCHAWGGGCEAYAFLENVIAPSCDEGRWSNLYFAGVDLLFRNWKDVPREPTGYPELEDLFRDLRLRDEIGAADLREGDLVGYLYDSSQNADTVRMFQVAHVEAWRGGYAITRGPCDETDDYLAMTLMLDSRRIVPSEAGRGDDLTWSDGFREDVGQLVRRFVPVTRDDMRLVKKQMPVEIEPPMQNRRMY